MLCARGKEQGERKTEDEGTMGDGVYQKPAQK